MEGELMLFSKPKTTSLLPAESQQAISNSQFVVELGADGHILRANQTFLDHFGYVLQDIEGKPVSLLLGDQNFAKDGVEAAVKNLEHAKRSATVRMTGKDKSQVWVQATFIPIFNREGKLQRILQIAHDVAVQKQQTHALEATLAAINRVQAVIEFNLDGTILTANQNFLAVMGYSLEAIVGRHHSMFMPAEARTSPEYAEFWSGLRRGEFLSGEYERVGKDGQVIWIFGSYNPVADENGKLIKVVKFASDITSRKMAQSEMEGQMTAIAKSQAVIEFAMSGMILTANENFLKAVGYDLADIKGRHHSMFVDAGTRGSNDYAEFWSNLNRGQYQAGEYKRIGNGGREIWIQASYNPILDANGKPFKVVKYATDITTQVRIRMGNERVRGMMETVAAGAEELNASVREISEAMVKSRRVAIDAVQQVETADGQAQSLNDAAQSMQGIVELISNITGQINLLALNATIESARAGEAGRGFAVVASEVKSLANQAKQATDKIGQQIGNLNGISTDVVHALNNIKQSIQSVSEYVTATAAAVEEQSTVTSEMSSSMQRAAMEAAGIAAA